MKRLLIATVSVLALLAFVILINREMTKPLPIWPEPTEFTQEKTKQLEERIKRPVTRTQPVLKTKDPQTKLTIKVYF